MSTSINTGSHKKVLIVGAGIAGLSLAIMLEKQGIAFDIVERSPIAKPQGYSITIPRAGLEALKQIGIHQDVLAVGNLIQSVRIDSDEYTPARVISLEDVLTVRRSDLYNLLLARLQSRIRFNVTPRQYATQSGGETIVTFSGGDSGTYDLVVGADGMYSHVRSHIFPATQPKPIGVAYWTFFLPDDVSLPDTTHITQTWKAGKFAGVFPLPSSAGIVLSAHISPDVDLDTVDIKALFSDVGHPIESIVRNLNLSNIYRGHLKEVSLESWHKDSMVLIGDAAHAMTPATGMGSTAGMLDAIELSRALSATSDWNKSLDSYEQARKSHTRKTQVRSRIVTHAMLTSGVAGTIRKRAVRLLPERLFLHFVS